MAWRYVWKRDRSEYEPTVWGMVFPLGMYTTSTFRFDRAMNYGFLDPLPEALVFIALAGWIFSVIGLARTPAALIVR